jgi:hypothetical protein
LKIGATDPPWAPKPWSITRRKPSGIASVAAAATSREAAAPAILPL